MRTNAKNRKTQNFESNQSLEGLPLHNAASQRPLDCSLKLTDVVAVELGGLVVEGILGVWFVEQVDKPIDDRVDIQNLCSSVLHTFGIDFQKSVGTMLKCQRSQTKHAHVEFLADYLRCRYHQLQTAGRPNLHQGRPLLPSV